MKRTAATIRDNWFEKVKQQNSDGQEHKKTRVMDRQSYQIDSQEQKKTWVMDRQTYQKDRLKV